jgi:hypothetical protein
MALNCVVVDDKNIIWKVYYYRGYALYHLGRLKEAEKGLSGSVCPRATLIIVPHADLLTAERIIREDGTIQADVELENIRLLLLGKTPADVDERVAGRHGKDPEILWSDGGQAEASRLREQVASGMPGIKPFPLDL